MPMYRKKPVVIEAQQLIGTDDGEDARKVATWCGGHIGGTFTYPHVLIETLEGAMRAKTGDWIIRGVQGEFYPCDSEIFAATYEPTED